MDFLKSIDQFMPTTRTGVVFIILLAVVLHWLYFSAPYSAVKNWVDDQLLESDAKDDPQLSKRNLYLSIIGPQHIADFSDGEFLVTVRNDSAAVQTITIALDVLTSDNILGGQARLAGDNYQNSVTLKEMAPHEEQTITFLVGMPNDKRDSNRHLQLYADGSEVQLRYPMDLEFNQAEVLRLWFVKFFLLPPTASIVVPLFSLVIRNIADLVRQLLDLKFGGKPNTGGGSSAANGDQPVVPNSNGWGALLEVICVSILGGAIFYILWPIAELGLFLFGGVVFAVIFGIIWWATQHRSLLAYVQT